MSAARSTAGSSLGKRVTSKCPRLDGFQISTFSKYWREFLCAKFFSLKIDNLMDDGELSRDTFSLFLYP